MCLPAIETVSIKPLMPKFTVSRTTAKGMSTMEPVCVAIMSSVEVYGRYNGAQ
jgi:hypothetical protein